MYGLAFLPRGDHTEANKQGRDYQNPFPLVSVPARFIRIHYRKQEDKRRDK